ncbi:hypothetical protein GCM10020331_028590 [Ectobacillus funiculus]
MPALVSGITVTAIALVSYTAMAGVIGAGGLGNFAYLEGFQGSNPLLTFVATVAIFNSCVYHPVYWRLFY